MPRAVGCWRGLQGDIEMVPEGQDSVMFKYVAHRGRTVGAALSQWYRGESHRLNQAGQRPVHVLAADAADEPHPPRRASNVKAAASRAGAAWYCARSGPARRIGKLRAVVAV